MALFGNINYNQDEHLNMRHKKSTHTKFSFLWGHIVTHQKIITPFTMLLINTDYYIWPRLWQTCNIQYTAVYIAVCSHIQLKLWTSEMDFCKQIFWIKWYLDETCLDHMKWTLLSSCTAMLYSSKSVDPHFILVRFHKLKFKIL